MKTKNYKSQLQSRVRLLEACAAGITVLFLLLLLVQLTSCFGLIQQVQFPMVILVSFFAGFEATMVLRIARYKKIMKDEESLETLQIYEKDERNYMVQLKSFQMCFTWLLILLAGGWLVTAFLAKTVCYTLAAVMAVMAVLYGICRWYYSKKY